MTTDPFPVVIGTCLDAEAIWFNKIGPGEHRPVMLSNGAYAYDYAAEVYYVPLGIFDER